MLKRFWDWLIKDTPSRLEQEQARRIDYLELQLEKAHQEYRDLVERVAFPPSFNIPQAPSGPFQSVPSPNKTAAEAQRLSRLSKQRLEDQIAEMEKRAESISARDESLSAKANNETKEEEAEEA